MIKTVTHSIQYFQAPADYFWQWADKSSVIEWNNGATICYRDDLIGLLKEFPGKGLPRLDPVLLVIAACHGNVNIDHKLMLLQPINAFKDSGLYGLLDKAVECLQLIAALPENLRKGRYRLQLIQEVFEDASVLMHVTQLKDAVDELNSGRLDILLEEKKAALTRDAFSTDLGYLKNALEKFKNTSTLALKLRTGLDQLPEPVKVDLPERSGAGLFEQLEEDTRTRGLATLARKLLAVINIPLHSQGSGEHSYGGISDITNRGNYDRLLLSELAQDDALLMARLVNNEALYFRREEPPDNPKRKRTILLDASLKMWGVPRIFSLAAALAFVSHSKHGEAIAAYVLGPDVFFEVDLAAKEGVIQALETMHHSLHSGKGLEAVIAAGAGDDFNEYVLFTEIGLLHSAAFQASLQKVIEELRFIVAVSRTGELQFFECNHGRTRLLNTARLDLNELLAEPVQRVKPVKNENSAAPAFFNCQPSPLLFPKTRITQKPGKISLLGADGLLAVTENQRLLLILSKHKAAYEVLLFVEKGSYTFGYHDGNALLLVSNAQRKFLKLYSIQISTKEVNSFELPQEIGFTREIIFAGSDAFIRADTGDYTFNCNNYKLNKEPAFNQQWAAFAMAKLKAQHQLDQQLVNNFLQGSIGFHSTMYNMRELFISNKGVLVIGNYHLGLLWNNSEIRIIENTAAHSPACYSKVTNSNFKLLPNKSIKCCIRRWSDGSEAVIDARGLLHLKSAGAAIPEISIVLISGANTACWAADGTACGVNYFVEEGCSAIISCEAFYKKYIQLFIDHIVRYDITATV